MPASRMTIKGQVTIPKEIRERLDLHPGDQVEFLEEDHIIRVCKRVESSPFTPYLGYLRALAGQDPDALLDELRGEPDP